jgi:Cu/Ag efflux pump CusA
MMRWIIGASLQSRLLVGAVAAALIVFGITQLNKMPVDMVPEFSRPYVEIQTEALGLSAAEVEALITVPLEADMLNGAPWLDEIRSQSIPGLSSIVLVFEDGTDIMRARQMVQEKLTEVHTLPNVAKSPVMINPVSSTGRVMMIGLSSEKLSLIDMSVLARWTIVPKLTGVNGVANVSIWGERRRQLQVQVDPAKLAEANIRLMQIIRTAGNALWFSPLTFLEGSTPGTAGFIDTPNQRLGVRHLSPISKPEELAQVTVEGSDKRLGDIANVVEDHQPLIGGAIVNNKANIVLVVEKFPWANTVDVTRGVEKALDAMRPGLAGLDMDSTLFRPATYLEMAINKLSIAFVIGAALIVVAVGALLLDARAALVSCIAILLSFLTAVIVLYLNGLALNAMVLAGIAMAIGIVVDDAITEVSTILGRLRQHRQASSIKSYARIILEAALESRRTILYATMIILLVTLPAYFLAGPTGAFMHATALGFCLAVVASMVVALTVTPALCVMVLPSSPLDARQSTIVAQSQHGYSSILSRLVEKPRPVFAAICLLALVSLVIFVTLEKDSFLPTLAERDLVVELEGAPGTSHPAMNRLAGMATRELRSIPGIRNVSAHIGRAVLSDKVEDVNRGELWVSLDRDANYDDTVRRIHQVMDGYPGLDIDVRTYVNASLDRTHGDAEDDDIVVRIYGDDWNILRTKANEVNKAVGGIAGVASSVIEFPRQEPQVEIELKMDAAQKFGLKPGDIRRAAATLVSGIEVGYLFEEQKVFDVVVWGVPEIRQSLDTIQNLLIDAPIGGRVPLKEVANVRIVPSPTVIKREAVARYVEVGAIIEGASVASVATEIRNRLNDIEFPLEYRAELLEAPMKRLAARNQAIGTVIASAVGIFLVFQACVGSWSLTTALFITLPGAIAGGGIVAMLLGGNLTLGVLLGFVAVMGIAVRNSLTMIRQYVRLAMVPEHSNADSGLPSRRSAEQLARMEQPSLNGPQDDAIFAPGVVQRATWDRFPAILMTALVTAVAVLPLALIGDVPGVEILRPMALVILGGLVTSTCFALFAVPAMYLLFTPTRGADLDDLGTALVDEQEVRETIGITRSLEPQQV